MTSADARITVLLADDNLLVREGVRALLRVSGDVDVVAMAEDYDSLVARAVEHRPQVVVTDIRMPPRFADEGIEAAKEVRKRLPGTGIVVLSQYDDPEYAVALLARGAAGYAYLLKERVADGDRLARAVREVAAGVPCSTRRSCRHSSPPRAAAPGSRPTRNGCSPWSRRAGP